MKVNYDQLAHTYNQRYHEDPLDKIEEELTALAHQNQAKMLLEIGCGTGRWLNGLAAQVESARVYGLDFSRGMLAQAAARPGDLQLIQGTASQLPLQTNAFDLIFCVNALHHFDDPAEFIRQARRALRRRGNLAIIGQVPADRRNRWYVYDYFAGSYEADLARFPSWGTVTDWMIAAEFDTLQWQPLHWIIDDKHGWDVLANPFLQKHAVSQLALLSDADYMAGIEKIKRALQQADAEHQTVRFPTRLRLDMLVGTRTEAQ